MVQTNDGTTHAAKALSDGTLRFLALAVLEADPKATGLLCLEEPENGIHPERIVAMLTLLQDIAVDVEDAVSDDNPLRQVIINTHSPAVVAQVPASSLLFAETATRSAEGAISTHVVFSPISGTWRARQAGQGKLIQRGQIIRFLSPVRPVDAIQDIRFANDRLIDKPEFVQLMLWPTYRKTAHERR